MTPVAWQLVHSLATGAVLFLGTWRWQVLPLLVVIWALPAFLSLRYAAYPQPDGSVRGGSWLPNALTSSRLVLVLTVLAWHWTTTGDLQPAWLGILLLAMAEVTDYLDGRASRRAGGAGSSTFGAMFDMEVDAYVTGALALQAVLYRQAPVWLLAAGLWRYAYVVWEAGLTCRWRHVGRTLPYDLRMPAWFHWQAKAICVLSVVLLIVLSIPGLQGAVIIALSSIVVGTLSYSFVVSVRLLLRADVDTARSTPIRS